MLQTAPSAFSAILAHYIAVFTYDASQRLSTFQYFLTAFAFLTAAFTAIMTAKVVLLPQLAGTMVSAAAYALALLFGRLDKRNAQLVKLDQQPLAALQSAIAAELGENPAWHTFQEARLQARKLTTYGALFPLVYFVAACIAAGGAWVTATVAGQIAYPVAMGGAAASAAFAWFAIRQSFGLKTRS